MGIIDKTTYTLKCISCRSSEAATVFDEGSNWSGSNWQYSAKFNNFNTQWSGGGSTEPKLNVATCKSCGGMATIERC